MTGVEPSRRLLEVYLQPAMVGGGLGDIEEVLAVGRRLNALGWTPYLYRRRGRPLPPSVHGPWGWPAVRRIHRVRRHSPRAFTVTPWWGVSAVPPGERSGHIGPWSEETRDIEAAYGADRVVHLSLEEFARTLTSREQTRERWREGGVASREITRRMKREATAREVRQFHEAYRAWRGFDRPNVLHLFTGFLPSPLFGQEFPEAIQTGPLWPDLQAALPRRTPRRRWIWYASPSTSDRLAAELARWIPAPPPEMPSLAIEVRGPRPLALPTGVGVRWHWMKPAAPEEWSRRFASAGVRIVTGSRTLLEALAVRGPFLYFNGVLNRGSRTRRHRPEKIDALLKVWRRHGVPPPLRRELADFSRLRNVGPIVRRALGDHRWALGFPSRATSVDFPSGCADAGACIDRWTLDWAGAGDDATSFVRRVRASAAGSLSQA